MQNEGSIVRSPKLKRRPPQKEENVLAQEAVLDALLRSEEMHHQWPPWDGEDQLGAVRLGCLFNIDKNVILFNRLQYSAQAVNLRSLCLIGLCRCFKDVVQ